MSDCRTCCGPRLAGAAALGVVLLAGGCVTQQPETAPLGERGGLRRLCHAPPGKHRGSQRGHTGQAPANEHGTSVHVSPPFGRLNDQRMD